jgi:heterodisulfide reductase subunit C
LIETQAVKEKVDFVEEVASIPGGEGVRRCIQCGTCTGSCPNADKMDYPPRQIIAMVRAGMREEVLSSNSMWYCLSCYLCTVRCPQDIKPTELMHALECLSVRSGLSSKKVNSPKAYRAFVNSIKSNGRVHEFGFMLSYYLSTIGSYLPTRTNPFNPLKAFKLLGMLPLGLGLFLHGRLRLTPTKIKGQKELKAILDKAQSLGGAR